MVDDEPGEVRDWLPVHASRLGAKPPRRVPRWLGRIFGGSPHEVPWSRLWPSEVIVPLPTEAPVSANTELRRETAPTLRLISRPPAGAVPPVNVDCSIVVVPAVTAMAPPAPPVEPALVAWPLRR